jgi:hypothetical protein
MRTHFFRIVACVLTVVMAGLACDEDDAEDDAELLSAARKAVVNAEGYTVTVNGNNFVLPRWGGIDWPSEVQLASDGHIASGTLVRTGEPDATYAVIHIDGETFFKRSTCNEWFRIPGGGPDVFAPLLFTDESVLSGQYLRRVPWDGTAPRFEGASPRFGPVLVLLDPDNNRLLTVQTDNDTPDAAGSFSLLFDAWGEVPRVERPTGRHEDRGPGGIPC